jgi:hypothetical protein
VPIPPLDLPSLAAAAPLDQVRQNEAVMLFTERAAAASGTVELTAANQRRPARGSDQLTHLRDEGDLGG